MTSSDSVLLATGGYDHTIRFWQAHTGNCYKTVQHPDSQVNALAITPDKQMIGAAGYQHVRMYNVHSSNTSPTINYDGISRNVTSLGFQEDGRFMYTGGEDCSARIWDIRARNPQCQKVFQVAAPVNAVALHPNQVELFVGDQNGAIHVWDLKSDQNEQLIPEPDASIVNLTLNPEGTLLAAVTNEGACYVWSVEDGTSQPPSVLDPKTKINAHQRQALKCCFSLDSRYLATTSADTSCRIWRLPDFTMVTEVKAKDKAWTWDCAFSADAKFIITASSDNLAYLWDVETGEKKREYQGHQKAITALAFKDDYVD